MEREHITLKDIVNLGMELILIMILIGGIGTAVAAWTGSISGELFTLIMIISVLLALIIMYIASKTNEINEQDSFHLEDTKKAVKKIETNIIFNVNKSPDSEILHLIEEIDKKINKGYIFRNISIEHYKRVYRDEILKLYDTSKLNSDVENSIEEVLRLLLSNLRKPEESLAEQIEIKAFVSTLNTMIDMDGIRENALDKLSSKSISDMFNGGDKKKL